MSSVTRDYHNLRRTLRLNDNAISNDGDNEGIRITDTGHVGIGISVTDPGSLLDIRGRVATGADTAGVLTLSTAETTVRVGTADQLGRIDFQAPKETGGTDAVLVGASIHAVAAEDFSVSNNSTALVFSTGTTSAPIERLRIDQDGDITISDGSTGSAITRMELKVSNESSMKIVSQGSSSDYMLMEVNDYGETDISTVDSGGARGRLLYDIDGHLLYQATLLWLIPTAKTASSTQDVSLRITEALDVSSGAGGSDTHYGIWYVQTHTNIAGWDNVYLQYLTGAKSGEDSVFAVDDNATLSITSTGTAKSVLDMLTLTNTVNAADMDGTGSAIKFNQWYYDGSSPAIEDSGKIAVITENDWIATSGTRDSHISFHYSDNGTLAERIRFGRTPSGSDNAVIQGASGQKLIVKSVGTNVPMQISSGAGIELSHYSSFDGTSTTTGSVLKLRILEDFKNPTCDWSSGSTNIDHTATTGGVADDPSDDTLDGQLHIGLNVEAEEQGIPEGAEITGVSSATRVVIDKTTTAVGSNERVTFSPPYGRTILSRYSGTIVAEWEVQTIFRPATTVADQDATGIPAQLRGSTNGTGAIFLYMTNSVGQPIVKILPSGGGSGYITSFTDSTCDYNHTTGLNADASSGDSNVEDRSTIIHDDDNGAIKLYMSVVGEGIPVGSYVGEVVSDTCCRIHRGGGIGSIDNAARVAVTATNTNETLTFYERVCIQDADAGGSNYGVVEIYDAKDGVIAFGSHTTGQDNQGVSSTQAYFDFNEAGDRFVSTGHYRHLGSIFSIDMDTLFLSGAVHTKESGQDFTFIHSGDRMFFGNNTCNTCDIFIDSTSSTRRLWMGASTLTNGVAKEGASADWEAAGGLEIAVTNATGATTLDTHTGPLYTGGFAPLTLKPSGDLIFDLHAITTRGLSILYNITADRTTNAEGFYTAIDINFDKDSSTYPASDNTYKGIALDMDNTNATSGTSIMYGIYCTPTLTHSGDGGTPTVIGAYLNATGSSNGTSTSVGLRIDQAAASTADTNLGLQIRSAADTADFFSISTTTSGATTIATVDSDAAVAHLTLDPDGDVIISGADVEIDATKKLYLDGGGDTYIHEVSANKLDMVVGSTTQMSIDDGGGGLTPSVSIPATSKLFLDGGGDTYIAETSFDNVRHVVGGDVLLELTEAGNDGNLVDFGTSAAGFTSFSPTYGSNTYVYFNRSGLKAEVIFDGGNITNLRLIFPDVSCNCVLIIKQDGTGSRTITNYETYDQSAGNPDTLYFPNGGTSPTLTTTGNGIDILSIYWDNGRHTAYGVMSLDFEASS